MEACKKNYDLNTSEQRSDHPKQNTGKINTTQDPLYREKKTSSIPIAFSQRHINKTGSQHYLRKRSLKSSSPTNSHILLQFGHLKRAQKHPKAKRLSLSSVPLVGLLARCTQYQARRVVSTDWGIFLCDYDRPGCGGLPRKSLGGYRLPTPELDPPPPHRPPASCWVEIRLSRQEESGAKHRRRNTNQRGEHNSVRLSSDVISHYLARHRDLIYCCQSRSDIWADWG